MSTSNQEQKPLLRFAPSPNGLLHLGHAYSALANRKLANELSGDLLLRIEDIDLERCLPEYETAMLEDLDWLGVRFDGAIRRQSEHFSDYQDVVDSLISEGLAYPSFLSRGEIRREVARHQDEGKHWPTDPDGVPHVPETDKNRSQKEREELMNERDSWPVRLDVNAAIKRLNKPLFWHETGNGPDGETGKIPARPQDWGDIIIARKDTPTSYHIACVLDDALAGITHVVRGRDLFFATSIQRLLQELLGLNEPLYHHHDLILDDEGRKLSKSQKDTAIRQLRAAGLTPFDIKKMIGLV